MSISDTITVMQNSISSALVDITYRQKIEIQTFTHQNSITVKSKTNLSYGKFLLNSHPSSEIRSNLNTMVSLRRCNSLDYWPHMTAFPHIFQGKSVQSINIISSFSLTSVTAKLLLPQGTTLYHFSCSTSINPCDLYWLISSDILEVKGELGGRPMPYPRRKYNLRWVFHLRGSWDVATTLAWYCCQAW